MAITRSNHGREEEKSSGSGGTTTETTATAGTSATTGTGTTATTATTGTSTSTTDTNATGTTATGSTATTAAENTSGVLGPGVPADTSGIRATPAASTATVVERRPASLMPPPPAAKPPPPARSSRSRRLREELETREKLAELELRRIKAEEKLAKIRQEKMDIASSEEESGEEEDLAPRRVADWLAHRPDEAAIEPPGNEERPQPVVYAQRRTGPEEDGPRRSAPAIDVSSLTTALAEAIQASKSYRKYIPDLPSFSGQSSEWLQFKAAYDESAPSFSSSENVARIRKGLKGTALETVSALLISQPHPNDVIQALERRYGRPDALLLGEIEKMKGLPRLSDSPRDLCLYASRIANTVTTIELLKKPHYLYNPGLLRSIVEKLTPILRSKWYDYSADNETTPDLKRIADFMNKEADRCAPYAPPEQITENKEVRPAKRRPERAYAVAAGPDKKKEEKPACPLCKGASHQLPSCPQFRKSSTSERWEIAKKHHMCYRCLISTHRRFVCRAKPCGHQGCPMRHHQLLHHEKEPPTASQEEEQPAETPERVLAAAASVAAANSDSGRAYLKIMPVTLRGPRAEVDTFALLDDGSTISIIDATLAASLGLEGPTEPMWVQGIVGNESSHERSKKVELFIRNRRGGDEHLVTYAHTMARLDFAKQSVGEKELQGCKHLEDIRHELTYGAATPKILIGQDNWDLVTARELREGRRDQLVASRTILGWVLHGHRVTRGKPRVYCCAHLTRVEPKDNMEQLMKEYFAIESLSIEPRKPSSDPEQQALRILEEKSRRLPDGRFETGLLWREKIEEIPSNRVDALKRLHTLERKLDRDEDLKRQYNERVNNLLASNYAERATEPPSKKTWYLPHFAVCNPEKPKIRLVHDAAAVSRGRSLNSMLLPGPDFLQSLPGVIMRFRQRSIAVSADIKEMFMQIKIREEDRDALRFLWRGDNREGEPEEYRMTSVIFGASSSPCTALYIKNRNAQEHAERYPQAAQAIERNHYMDDYLQSFNTVEEARQITREVDYVHKQAGFQLRGWASNASEAISEAAGSKEQEENTVPIGGSEMEKTLGLLWDTRQDSVRFRLNVRRAPPEVIDDRRPPTKREALSIIMSIFDPLGLISPVTTPAKRIMQDTWRYNASWDEAIPAELRARWSDWLGQLRSLGNLSIPRCYDVTPATRYELHTFVDASEEAYAAAVYWRMKRADGTTSVALVAAKSRVTPTKPISIPRLELQSAVLGVRLARSAAEEHDFEIATKTYWSDSRTALAWIRAEPRTFKTFVAHRLAEIEDATKKNEWRWLPSAHNVADDATRATPADFDAAHRWFTGPQFLYEEESSWPREVITEVPATGEEKEVCCATITHHERCPAVPAFERFSKWTRLLRATARVLQFIDLLRTKKEKPRTEVVAAARRKRTRANEEKDGAWNRRTPHARAPARPPTVKKEREYLTLDAKYLLAAEALLLRVSQEETYEKERLRIVGDQVPDKDDRLAKLSVYMDKDNIVRLRGRIAEAEGLTEEAVRPAVLHGRHVYTQLYISHVHEKLHHGGTEIVVNELRQRFHIVKIRPAVKQAIARCPMCRLRRAKPAAPATGDLPSARLAHHARPFTYTGLDYFGPVEVTVGRHREKRYVALFTCMTSRAVHLEVVASLSTDSAINALRRFIARRGCPTELWSDNATAFHGANKELTTAMQGAANARRISWRFLPPAAPFMAGAWERMVRTVKEAMKTTLHEKSPSEETLQTLLAEAESTVNSRPLTYVAVNPDDPPALTPNMILLGPDCHSPAPGAFDESDVNARQHWRRAQQLADTFWQRWVREYAPLLQHRREPHGVGASPAIGDLVIICDSNLPRNTWPRGRVTQTYPGKDGVVRVVDVTTSKGHVLRRPTKKIVVLPVDSQGDGGRNVHDAK